MEGEPSFVPEGKQTGEFPGNPYGRTLHFGIREHAMGAILNGIALQSLTRPYGGTFLIFSDYMRPAVRLAALMKLPVTYVWTHDSIGLGETARPTSPSSNWPPSARSPASTSYAPPTRTRPPSAGAPSWSTTTGPPDSP